MSDRSIRETIQHLAGTHENDTVSVIDATVDDVDALNRICSCTPIGGSIAAQRTDVRLMAALDDGILIIPAKDSTVTILLSTFTSPVIVSYSEVDSIIFRGGDLGGLVLLLAALKSFNQLEKDINNLKNLIKAWTPAPGDGGAALKTALTVWFGQALTITQRVDLENENITQG